MPDSARHILLVEDDPELLMVLTQVLETDGYHVSGAARREEALEVLQQGGVDLIVTDSVLRGGNGNDIAGRAIAGGVPVILMSGEPERIEALRVGSHPFLQKPFRAAELLRLIDTVLKPRPA